ncbi:MAG: CPBP family intramembrane metalloprotease [Anaerolineaceae bacterium]|nr:CPBP family intramembrane metalloprotease [Anaerolineaceae bacterium]
MDNNLLGFLKGLFVLRWKPGKDLVVVGVSWILVVASLYTATVIVDAETGGGIPYFLLYAVVTATLFGVGLPVYWMVFWQKRPIHDLGITKKNILLSLILQVALAGVILPGGFNDLTLPPFEQLAPLICLALAIGFFEAIFWRGWVLLRLEEAFGFIPAALLGSVLYAAYHIGYDMPFNEMVFLFFIGLMYAVAFRLTGSIFILWPLFQPGGQLITLVKEGLELPLLASVGFLEVFIVMVVLLWLSAKFLKKCKAKSQLVTT